MAGGRLGDIFGRKRLLVIGVVIFASTSAIAGASRRPGDGRRLSRILQGVGAAIAFPVSLAVVTNAFPPHRVQRAIGIVFGIAVLGTAVGPFLGGLITELLSWRFVFWLNIPIAAVVVWLVLTSVTESRDESVPRRLDVPGLLLIVSGVALVSFTFDRAADWGWTSAATVGSMVGGLVLLVLFVVAEAHVRYPLLDLSLFRIRVFDVMIAGGSGGQHRLHGRDLRLDPLPPAGARPLADHGRRRLPGALVRRRGGRAALRPGRACAVVAGDGLGPADRRHRDAGPRLGQRVGVLHPVVGPDRVRPRAGLGLRLGRHASGGPAGQGGRRVGRGADRAGRTRPASPSPSPRRSSRPTASGKAEDAIRGLLRVCGAISIAGAAGVAVFGRPHRRVA